MLLVRLALDTAENIFFLINDPKMLTSFKYKTNRILILTLYHLSLN